MQKWKIRINSKAHFLYIGSMLCSYLFSACSTPEARDVQIIMDRWGEAKGEFERVLKHYRERGERKKMKAAIYLIKNMEGHYYHTAPYLNQYRDILEEAGQLNDRKSYIVNKFDSLHQIYGNEELGRVPDYKVVTTEMLIENIDYAFKAWEMPWAKNLSFDEFCHYILPYKISTEKPTFWRKKLFEQFSWVADSFRCDVDRIKVCAAVNDQLHWFKFQWPFTFPTEQDFDCMMAGKTGRCSDATTLAAYAMRAVGIPVTVDYTPQWANRSYGHHWNSLMVRPNRFINFQGTERNPGYTKIEYDPNEEWFFKRAKVYRISFERSAGTEWLHEAYMEVPNALDNPFYEDVTADFIPVSNVTIDVTQPEALGTEILYLCVFDNQQWVPIDWTLIRNGKAVFKDIGRSIVYIGATYSHGSLDFRTRPFLLASSGSIKYLQADHIQSKSVRLFRKYPYNNSNNIKVGDRYELSFWDHGWKSLGIKRALKKSIDFDSVPSKSLLLLKNLDRGRQERPFTIEDDLQVFW